MPEPRTDVPDIRGFEMLKPVGAGAYGEVWLAKTVTGEMRAVKIVRRNEMESGKAYEREFNATRHFGPISRDHQGFVHLLHVDVDEEQDLFYYVMEAADDYRSGRTITSEIYVPHTLREQLRDKMALPIAECLKIGIAVSAATAFLHRKGLVHRDLKPSNIIFVNGQPKLADIGLVTDALEAHSYVGTEGYLPREDSGTPAADVFAIGKILYEMSSGRDRLDFPGAPAPEAHTKSQLFPKLNNIVFKACQDDPKRRYKSAAALHAALNRLTVEDSTKPKAPELKARKGGGRLDKRQFKKVVNEAIEQEHDQIVAAWPNARQYLTYDELQQVTDTVRGLFRDKLGRVPDQVEVALKLSEAVVAPGIRQRIAALKAVSGIAGGVGGVAMIVNGIGLALGWGQGLIAAIIAYFTGTSLAGPIGWVAGGSALALIAGYFALPGSPKRRGRKAFECLLTGVDHAVDQIWHDYQDRLAQP